MSFWHSLKKPIVVLAPMADVTDAAFRRMITKYSSHVRADGTVGGPDVMWTEFVSADGLVRATPEGKEKLMADLIYKEEERPIVAQLFSSNPEYMESAAMLCAELGFDGIDINMGCPDRSVERQGCGAAMIKSPDVARTIIRATKQGIEKSGKQIPVTVKTRIGYNRNELATWLPVLLEEAPDVITVHARTRKEMSKVPARWEHVAEAVALRDSIQTPEWLAARGRKHQTLIFGNGDVISVEDAYAKCAASGADGAMLGRAIFGNPWLFHPTKRLPERITSLESSSLAHRTSKYDSLRDSLLPGSSSREVALSKRGTDIEIIPLSERFRVMLEHTELFTELLPHKNFAIMKKHYKAYVNGFPGAHELRTTLMESSSLDEIRSVVNTFLNEHAEVT